VSPARYAAACLRLIVMAAAGVGAAVCSHGFTQTRFRATYTPGGYLIMQADIKQACGARLRRIEGQVRGLAKMVEDERYCLDIVTQIAAVRAALRKVEQVVLREHVAHCVEGAIRSGDADEQRRKVSELIEVLGRTAR
jgi:DNA-binding FrmR family transcriptional regulator